MDTDTPKVELFRRRRKTLGGFDVLSELSKGPTGFTPERAMAFLDRVPADPAITYDAYAGAETLRAWVALALFHRFDPGILCLNHSGRIAYLGKILDAASPHHPNFIGLFQFKCDLELLRGDLVAEVEMKHRVRADQDPIQIPVSRSWFERWVGRCRLSPCVPRGVDQKKVMAIDPPPQLEIVIQVNNDFYRTIENGGTFDPRHPGLLELTRQALRAAGIKFDVRARVGATFLARPGQEPGRKCKG